MEIRDSSTSSTNDPTNSGSAKSMRRVSVHSILSAASAAVSGCCLGFGLRAKNNPTAKTKTAAAAPNHGHACNIASHVRSLNIVVYCRISVLCIETDSNAGFHKQSRTESRIKPFTMPRLKGSGDTLGSVDEPLRK